MLDDRIPCPLCDEGTNYQIIKSGQENLIKCNSCGDIRPYYRERQRQTRINVIVHQEAISKMYHVEIPANEELYIGRELLVDDDPEDVIFTEITSLETNHRVERALAREVRRIWARSIDEVVLKISISRRGQTKSIRIKLSGEETYEVGEIREVEGIAFRVNKIKLRGEGFARRAEAKDILRVWGRWL
jgi:uncharacterized Zn finger protein